MNESKVDKEEAKNSKRSKGKSTKRSGGEKPSGRGTSSGETPRVTSRDEHEGHGQAHDHEHDEDLEVNPPSQSLCERIEPDKWNNIPVCLSKAFRDDVDNQEYLERYIVNVEQQIVTQGNYFRRLLDNVTSEQTAARIKGLIQFETKLKGNIADAKLNLISKIEANFEEEKAKQEELNKSLKDAITMIHTMEKADDAKSNYQMILNKMDKDIKELNIDLMDFSRSVVENMKEQNCMVPGLIGTSRGEPYRSLP